MLLSAMRQQNDAVALDLLTYADLELLKSRKAGGRPPGASTHTAAATAAMTGLGAGGVYGGAASAATGIAGESDAPALPSWKAGKRFLILTYVVEFDRVHYPLPLTPLEAPSIATLQRQVRRLRREIGSFRTLSGLPETAATLTASGLAGAAQASLVSSVSGMQREIHVLRERNTELSVRAWLCGRCEDR